MSWSVEVNAPDKGPSVMCFKCDHRTYLFKEDVVVETVEGGSPGPCDCSCHKAAKAGIVLRRALEAKRDEAVRRPAHDP